MNSNIHITHVKTNSQNLEMWISIDISNDITTGHIFMTVEGNNKIKLLDAWVHEDYRRMGIYRSLWQARWEHILENYEGYTIYAWCKDTSLPLLLEKGFNKGEIATYVERKI
jgi:ribosomal protein S18 acetylase RimI-like enzyme|tara:strand:+ start:263 stop:598 length:336 start_codon:yes stop_codon:yes gene_type:complete